MEQTRIIDVDLTSVKISDVASFRTASIVHNPDCAATDYSGSDFIKKVGLSPEVSPILSEPSITGPDSQHALSGMNDVEFTAETTLIETDIRAIGQPVASASFAVIPLKISDTKAAFDKEVFTIAHKIASVKVLSESVAHNIRTGIDSGKGFKMFPARISSSTIARSLPIRFDFHSWKETSQEFKRQAVSAIVYAYKLNPKSITIVGVLNKCPLDVASGFEVSERTNTVEMRLSTTGKLNAHPSSAVIVKTLTGDYVVVKVPAKTG